MHHLTGPHRWRDRALCRYEDPELFHPVGDAGPARAQTERAKAVCATPCPVQVECLATALSIPGCAGVWAGTDENDRRHLVRAYRQRVNA
jgi:WhiB family redox-sensing transcriptional regulator